MKCWRFYGFIWQIEIWSKELTDGHNTVPHQPGALLKPCPSGWTFGLQNSQKNIQGSETPLRYDIESLQSLGDPSLVRQTEWAFYCSFQSTYFWRLALNSFRHSSYPWRPVKSLVTTNISSRFTPDSLIPCPTAASFLARNKYYYLNHQRSWYGPFQEGSNWHVKETGMQGISFIDVNCGFWCQLGSAQNVMPTIKVSRDRSTMK